MIDSRHRVGKNPATFERLNERKEETKMTINEVMKIGCDGYTNSEREAEKERRLKVVEKINKIFEKMNNCEDKAKQRRFKNELRTIKAVENVWLKEVAWFMY